METEAEGYNLVQLSLSQPGLGFDIPRSLSLQEEAELIWSNKKIKEGHHASFKGGEKTDIGPRLDQGFVRKSFKDKLIGEIPGAYSQAFDLTNMVEDDDAASNDDNVGSLRASFAAVNLSKFTKQRIRAPWSKAFTVKVFGQPGSLNYIQMKLIALWKPTGRLDLVDLEKDFYLVRFSLKEDHDAVLRKVAVWIRFNGLPVEYYDAEVLKEIGEAIGKVLRINTHTASKARRRYARLCVQIGVDKPLITIILIGKLEQQFTSAAEVGNKSRRSDHKDTRDYHSRNSSLSDPSVDFALINVAHSESMGISNGEENAGIQTNLNDHIGQQPCNQACADLPPHRGIQLPLSCTQVTNGGPRALPDSDAREGSFWGNSGTDMMEFEGESESPTSN
nr:hypothetical protein CFP56_66449 [Quercus suber]